MLKRFVAITILSLVFTSYSAFCQEVDSTDLDQPKITFDFIIWGSKIDPSGETMIVWGTKLNTPIRSSIRNYPSIEFAIVDLANQKNYSATKFSIRS